MTMRSAHSLDPLPYRRTPCFRVSYAKAPPGTLSLARDLYEMTTQRHDGALERQHPRVQLERVKDALKVRAAIKRVLSSPSDQITLLTQICRTYVEVGAYSMAWIAFAGNDKRKSVIQAARWGGPDHYFEDLRAQHVDTVKSATPAGAAMRSGMPIVVENVDSEPRFGRWRRLALKHGIGSCVCLPLRSATATVGALVLYAPCATALSGASLEILCEAANDLALVITHARRYAEYDDVVRTLTEREARYRAAKDGGLEAFSELRAVRDASGALVDLEFVEVNRHAEAMLGLTRKDLIGRKYSEIFPSDKARAHLEDYFRVVDTGQTLEREIEVRLPSGKPGWMHHQLVPLGDGLAVFARDITPRKHMELELRKRLCALARAEELAQTGAWTFDLASGAISCSAGLRRLFGLASDDRLHASQDLLELFPAEQREGLRKTFASMVREKRAFRHERQIVRADGEQRVLLFHGEPHVDDAGAVASFIGFAQDITQRKRNEARMERLATHDALTALPNRTVLSDRVAQAIAHAGRRSTDRVAVLRIDLDRFSVLIGGLGHSFGDEVIKAAAVRLQAHMRAGDTLASLGGDGFVVLLQYVRRPEDVLWVARRLQDAFSESFVVNGREVYLTCSMGASVYPDDGRDTETLLKNADAALQRVRAGGGNGFQYYTHDLGEWASQRIRLEAALRRAIDAKQFELHYQPQIALKSGRICGVEALIRWRHPELGLVPPANFIPLAEETGLIIPMGQWVLNAACEQNRYWRQAGGPPLRIAVNVSAKQFARGDLERTIAELKARGDFKAGELELEVTEGVVMHDIDATRARLKRLRSLGAIVSIDDFGTGYSSLSYLRSLPLDRVKIDKSFVGDIASGRKAQRLVAEIVALAHALGFEVVAEGVEHEREANFLRTHNCDAAQGYLFSKPLPAAGFEAFLKQAWSLEARRTM